MARTKNTERKTGLISNPFKTVNADVHGVQLIDVDKIQQLCVEKGKDMCFRIQVHEFLVVVGSCVQM